MARRLLKTWQKWRFSSSSSSSSFLPFRSLNRHSYEHKLLSSTNGSLRYRSASDLPRFYSILPAALAGALGIGIFEDSYADAHNADYQSRPATESLPDSTGMVGIASHERQKLEELLRNKGMQKGSYPSFTVSVKGQQVAIKFQIPPTCELPRLIVLLASCLGLKTEYGGASEMKIRAWDSTAAWQLLLTASNEQNESGREGESYEKKNTQEGNLNVLLFKSLITPDDAEIEFIKQGSFSFKELDALACVLKLASERPESKKALDNRPRRYSSRRESKPYSATTEKSISALEEMGVRIFGMNEHFSVSDNDIISWDNIAGYDQQKREIEDTILLALQSPEVYDDIARRTRCKFESNRPRAILFEGPPGTGKTSCARVIANQAGVPLLYVPLEVVMSKYYGESERLLGTVFSLANELSSGAIIFLDEVDSFAGARDNEMHEATRRILSVLLRQIDGFEQEKRVVVIAATNRKQDLDPALISRFDSMITFDLPDQQTRAKIARQYAKHLKESELVEFAKVTEQMSGRDIRDVCQQTERRWASKIIRGEVASIQTEHGNLPPIREYIYCAEQRQRALLDIANKIQNSIYELKRRPFAFS